MSEKGHKMCQINSNKANNNSCNTELLRDIQQGTSKIYTRVRVDPYLVLIKRYYQKPR